MTVGIAWGHAARGKRHEHWVPRAWMRAVRVPINRFVLYEKSRRRLPPVQRTAHGTWHALLPSVYNSKRVHPPASAAPAAVPCGPEEQEAEEARAARHPSPAAHRSG